MKRLEVRCCCNPNKLMGWLDVPDTERSFRAALLPTPNFGLPLAGPNPPSLESAAQKTVHVELPIAWIVICRGFPPYPAIKAEDVPIETLRRIPGFIECTWEQDT